MKALFASFLLACLTANVVRAEYRVVAIEIFKPQNGKAALVNIHSEMKSENLRNLKVADAAAVVQKIQGWGSSVGTVIVTDNVELAEYINILQAVAKNHWMSLTILRPKGAGGQDPAKHTLNHFNIKDEPFKPEPE